MDLSGQTAVVTGASRGIGRAIASCLAERGASVALWSRREEQVRDAAEFLASNSQGKIVAQAVDVRHQEQVDDAVAHAAAELGPITLLVNNAGTAGPAGMDWAADPDDWWECVETTVRGSFNCARSVLPEMLQRGSGRVVEMASVTGTGPFPLLGATSVAKAALIRHAENLAVATAETGVSVFAIYPGMVATDLLASYRSNAQMAAYFDSLPDEMYTPPDVAGDAVARIASGELDALSGCFIDVTTDLDALLAGSGAMSPDYLKLRLTS